MSKKIELLAPGGDVDSIKAAIIAGADAIYCGLNKFNARNRAANIDFNDLLILLKIARNNECQIFITLNIIITESEIPNLIKFLNKLINANIDGIIIQDLGLFYILNKFFPNFAIHSSTQLTTHNKGQIKFLHNLNTTRINFSRELSLKEIAILSETAHKYNVLTEVFVHGSYCISFSGACYISSVHGGNSGNRGRCSQPCRDKYLTTSQNVKFPLNLKDNSAYLNLKELQEAGVDSIKIEGRIKKAHYVHTIVKSYREQLNNLYNSEINKDTSALHKVFNRDFSNSFLKGNINKDMFIDNPRNNAAIYKASLKTGCKTENLEQANIELNKETADLITSVKNKTDTLILEKTPIEILFFGKEGTLLKVSVKVNGSSFDKSSFSKLKKSDRNKLDELSILKRLKIIDDTEYFIEKLNLHNLDNNLFVPFKELSILAQQIIFSLNGTEIHLPISLPKLPNNTSIILPNLSVLISSKKDIYLSQIINAKIYFQLPNSIGNDVSEFIDLFNNNTNLIAWFPSILINEDYEMAVSLLSQLSVKEIVTNNLGVAYEANKLGINWVAGPFLNIVNSYSLLTLNEFEFCKGAFVSNELNQFQIKGIKKPKNFELYFSIYHPIELMISRQCFFFQVTGCYKDVVDDECVTSCKKNAIISNIKDNTFFIEKSKGNFNRIYNQKNYLNFNVLEDIKNKFNSYFIDLRNIQTQTKVSLNKIDIINLFNNYLGGNYEAKQSIIASISNTTNKQYTKGI